jgi:hypothetical protein
MLKIVSEVTAVPQNHMTARPRVRIFLDMIHLPGNVPHNSIIG